MSSTTVNEDLILSPYTQRLKSAIAASLKRYGISSVRMDYGTQDRNRQISNFAPAFPGGCGTRADLDCLRIVVPSLDRMPDAASGKWFEVEQPCMTTARLACEFLWERVLKESGRQAYVDGESGTLTLSVEDAEIELDHRDQLHDQATLQAPERPGMRAA